MEKEKKKTVEHTTLLSLICSSTDKILSHLVPVEPIGLQNSYTHPALKWEKPFVALPQSL